MDGNTNYNLECNKPKEDNKKAGGVMLLLLGALFLLIFIFFAFTMPKLKMDTGLEASEYGVMIFLIITTIICIFAGYKLLQVEPISLAFRGKQVFIIAKDKTREFSLDTLLKYTITRKVETTRYGGSTIKDQGNIEFYFGSDIITVGATKLDEIKRYIYKQVNIDAQEL